MKCPSSAWAYWESLSSLGTPGNQPNRLATNSSAAIMAIEVGLVVIEPTRDIALTTKPMVPSGMYLEICPVKRPAIRMYLIKLRGQLADRSALRRLPATIREGRRANAPEARRVPLGNRTGRADGVQRNPAPISAPIIPHSAMPPCGAALATRACRSSLHPYTEKECRAELAERLEHRAADRAIIKR